MFIRILRDPAAGDGAGGTAVATPGAGASGSAPIFTQGSPADQGVAAAAQKANEDFVKIIPDTYKDKPYLKGVDSPDKLFKLLDGSQELIGKRPNGIPAADAPKEQWDAFYKTLGRPDNADAYTIKPTDGLKYNDDFVKSVKGIFHEAGLTQKQAELVQSKFDQALLGFQKAQGDKSAEQNVNFDKLAETTFGTEKDAKLTRAKAIMTEHAPQELLKHLDSLSNENLIIMAGVIDSIATKFISPDKLPGSGQGGQGAPMQTMEQRREEARRLMLTKEFNDPFHPDHDKIKKQVSDLYAPLRAAAK